MEAGSRPMIAPILPDRTFFAAKPAKWAPSVHIEFFFTDLWNYSLK